MIVAAVSESVKAISTSQEQAAATTSTAETTAFGSPFQQATANLQNTARWIVTSLAAAGAALVAGVPLTGVGALDGVDLIWAVGGLVGALLGIALAIPPAARVFTTEYITLAALNSLSLPGRRRTAGDRGRVEQALDHVRSSREELFGAQADDLGELYGRFVMVNARMRNRPGLEEPAPPDESQPSEAVIQAQSQPTLPAGGGQMSASGGILIPAQRDYTPTAKAEVLRDQSEVNDAAIAVELHAAVTRVVDFANYHATRRLFAGLYRRLAASGLIVALGVGVYAYQASRPSGDKLFVKAPTPVLLSLPADHDWQQRLGPRCDLSRVSAVAIEGEIGHPIVVTTPSSTCSAQRFELPENGVAVPVDKLPASP